MKTVVHGELFSRFDKPQGSVGTTIGCGTMIHKPASIGGIRTEHIGIIRQDKSLSQENLNGFLIAAADFDGTINKLVIGRLLIAIFFVNHNILLHIMVQLVLVYLMHAIRPFPKFGVGRNVDQSKDSLVIGPDGWSLSDFHRAQKGGEGGKQQYIILVVVLGGIIHGWRGRRLQAVGISFEERHSDVVLGVLCCRDWDEALLNLLCGALQK